MEIDIEKEAINWRWKKLEETLKIIEEPIGICETIDAFVWGKQSWKDKTLSDSKFKIVRRVLNG